MKRKKGQDFPEINYTFMNRSTYRKKNQTFRRMIKWILSVVIICLFAYAVFYIFVISKNPNLFEELSNDKKRSDTSLASTSVEEKRNTPTEEKNTQPTEESTPSPLPEPPKEKVSIEDKISLQMALYGLQDQKEIQSKKEEYLQLTGEDFETAFLFPSDTQVIPDDILQSSGREQAAVLRNEIFARHGYPFDAGRLLSYFRLKTWYQEKDKQIELSELEKENVNKILEYEISKGWKQK